MLPPKKGHCPLYLRLWPYFLAMFLVSFFFLTQSVARSQPVYFSAVFEAIGGAGVQVGIPLLVAGLLRWIERRRPSTGPLFAGVIIWGILLGLWMLGTRAP